MKIGLLNIEQINDNLDNNNIPIVNDKCKDSGLLGQITHQHQSNSKNGSGNDTINHTQEGLLNVKAK